jgi:hypothetical protein
MPTGRRRGRRDRSSSASAPNEVFLLGAKDGSQQHPAHHLADHQRSVDGPRERTHLFQRSESRIRRPVRGRRRQDRQRRERPPPGALRRHDGPGAQRRGLQRDVCPGDPLHAVPRRYAVHDAGSRALRRSIQRPRAEARHRRDRQQDRPRRPPDGEEQHRQPRGHRGRDPDLAAHLPHRRGVSSMPKAPRATVAARRGRAVHLGHDRGLPQGPLRAARCDRRAVPQGPHGPRFRRHELEARPERDLAHVRHGLRRHDRHGQRREPGPRHGLGVHLDHLDQQQRQQPEPEAGRRDPVRRRLRGQPAEPPELRPPAQLRGDGGRERRPARAT